MGARGSRGEGRHRLGGVEGGGEAERDTGVAGGEGGKRKREIGRDVLFLSPFFKYVFWLYTVTNAISFQSTLINLKLIFTS